MYRRPETKAAEEKVYRQKQIGEFMTTWKDFPRPGLAAWAERRKADLMGTVCTSRPSGGGISRQRTESRK
jgi:hypothetical protein